METNNWFWVVIGIIYTSFIIDGYLSYLNRKAAKPTLPKKLETFYDKESYAKQQAYFKDNNYLNSISDAVALIVNTVILFTYSTGKLDKYVHEKISNELLATLVFLGINFVFETLITLPFTIYKTFKIEEKYGFNKTTPTVFIADTIKQMILSVILNGGLMSIVFLLFKKWPTTFWIYAFIVFAVISILINMFYSQLIVPLFNKQIPLEDGDLKTAIQEFGHKTGFEIKDIFVIDGSKRSTKANAYFSGFGKKKRVCLYDTLIADLTTEEVVAVLAHEIGHCKCRHIPKTLAIALSHSFIIVYMFAKFINMKDTKFSMILGSDKPTFELGMYLFTILHTPVEFVVNIFFNSLSRSFEYQADKFATINGCGDSLVEGLKKISLKSLVNLTPAPAYVFVNYSHPTLIQRIDAVNKIKTQIERKNL